MKVHQDLEYCVFCLCYFLLQSVVFLENFHAWSLKQENKGSFTFRYLSEHNTEFDMGISMLLA